MGKYNTRKPLIIRVMVDEDTLSRKFEVVEKASMSGNDPFILNPRKFFDTRDEAEKYISDYNELFNA